ncbi:hypothetical protein LSTR_LSTR008925 [Laodelphax striatellus]|uniref:non-specific serine/threonine protein kinase n=1 Tax=Laodelphax striatellus TaxID=195883 RepID=A0A482WMB8_LAOST|nr:hypothetical protein LSTR_LSTR008925 [Laodelphax striatellus]
MTLDNDLWHSRPTTHFAQEMNRSRRKPLRTYGRKKNIKRRICVTNINVTNITNYTLLVVNPARNPSKQNCDLDIYNSSTESKFDRLIGKKPTNIFLSSNSSLSSSEQKSGLKGSSLLSTLGSINEKLPLESLSGKYLENEVAIASSGDDTKKSSLFHVETKQFVEIKSRTRKLRLSKRFSLSRRQEKIGNSTPIGRNAKELKNSPIEWGLSPIPGTVENDSLNSSKSPDMFELDSDNEKKSQEDNNPLPKRHSKINRSCFQRDSAKRDVNRRSSSHQTVGESSVEEVQNDSVVSCLADLFKDQNLEETPSMLSCNSLSPSKDSLDDQRTSNSGDISNELSLGLSMLEVGVAPDEYGAEDCKEQAFDEKEDDDSIVHNSPNCCSKISSLLEKPNSWTKTSLANSSRSFSSAIGHKEQEDAAESTCTSTTSSVPHFRSKCSKSFGSVFEDFFSVHELENSGDKCAKEADDENNDVSLKLQYSPVTSTGNFKADENNRQGEKEEVTTGEEEDCNGKEVSGEDYSDEEENYNYEDSNKKEEVSDEKVNFSDEDCHESFEKSEDRNEGKTINVLDADDSLCMTGFELGNDGTLVLEPGKKYRRSIFAHRQSKSSIGNISRAGCSRHSIIRPSAKLKASTRMTLITTTIEEDLDETVQLINVDEDKISAKQQVLNLCNQTDILIFDSVLPERKSKGMKKIGEGVYGEVFMMTDPTNKESIVVKIIPIEGNIEYNGDVQKKFHEIISEIHISQALSNLKKDKIDKAEFWTDVYCNIIACNCFQGEYPKFLLDLWDKYHKENVSENDSPDIFPQDQLYISLKMSHGGGDIQNHLFSSARQSYYTVVQVIFALAVAERALEFEHRDLHIGNILVSKTKEKHIFFKIDGVKFKLPTYLRKATIIDYTLSRMNSENLLFYNDLGKDEELFLGKGDLQFQIYRDMRVDVKNQWQNFEPKTNLRWIHYLATKCITATYNNKSSSIHKQYKEKLRKLADEATVYSSCYEYIMNSDSMIELYDIIE